MNTMAEVFSSKDRAQFDHVDPSLPLGAVNDVDNLVTACPACNKAKGHRTPGEAGMTLQPAPPPPLFMNVFVDKIKDRLSTDVPPRVGSGREDTETGGAGTESGR